MNTIQLVNQEGIGYLAGVDKNSIDLVFTDPPYITSRSTGMDKWVDHVDARRKSTNNFKSEASWRSVKTATEWKEWCRQGNYAPGKQRLSALRTAKRELFKVRLHLWSEVCSQHRLWKVGLGVYYAGNG